MRTTTQTRRRAGAVQALAEVRQRLRNDIVDTVITLTRARAGVDPPLEPWRDADLEHWIETLVFALDGEPPPWHPHMEVARLLEQMRGARARGRRLALVKGGR